MFLDQRKKKGKGIILLLICIVVLFYNCKNDKEELIYSSFVNKEIEDIRLLKKVYDTTIQPSNYLYSMIEYNIGTRGYYEFRDQFYRKDLRIKVNGITLRDEILKKNEVLKNRNIWAQYSFITKKDTLYYIRSYNLIPGDRSSRRVVQGLRVAEPIAVYLKEDRKYMYYTPFDKSKLKIEKSQTFKVELNHGSSFIAASSKIHIKFGGLNLYGNPQVLPDYSIKKCLDEFSLKSLEIDDYSGLKYKYFEYFDSYTTNNLKGEGESISYFEDTNVLNNKGQ